MDNANIAHIGQETLKLTFDNKLAHAQALQGQSENEYQWNQRFLEAGDDSRDMGLFPNVKAAMDYANKQPEAHAEHALGQNFYPVHINEDGEIDGVHGYWFAPGYLDQKIDQPLKYYQLVKGKNPDDLPSLEESGEIVKGTTRKAAFAQQAQQNQLALKAYTDIIDARTKAADEQRKQDLAPYEKKKTIAETNLADAEADKARNPAPTAAEAREQDAAEYGPGGGRAFATWLRTVVTPAQDVETGYQLASQVHNMFYDANGNFHQPPTGAPAMVLLGQHIRTTLGKNAPALEMIKQHEGARGLGDDAEVLANKLTSGDPLSQNQIDAFTSLIGDARNQTWDRIFEAAATAGRPLDRIPFPEDYRQKKGQAPGRGSMPQPQPGAAAPQSRSSASPPAPAPTHVFSASAWLATHPGGNVEAAKAEATRQKYQVIQ
jgi:hypothetical protein